LPALYSITSIEAVGRMHSANSATGTPVIVTIKLNDPIGLFATDTGITPAVSGPAPS
jgi:hypothetical protein